MRFDHILAFVQFLTLTITAVTSVPLFVSYLRNVPINPIFVHLHVWFGISFIIVALIKISDRKKLILSQLNFKIKIKRFDRILAFTQVLTFAIAAITSVPLFVSYLRNTNPLNPMFIHLHAWFGLIFIIVAIIKISDRKKLILIQLGLKTNKKKAGKNSVSS